MRRLIDTQEHILNLLREANKDGIEEGKREVKKQIIEKLGLEDL